MKGTNKMRKIIYVLCTVFGSNILACSKSGSTWEKPESTDTTPTVIRDDSKKQAFVHNEPLPPNYPVTTQYYEQLEEEDTTLIVQNSMHALHSSTPSTTVPVTMTRATVTTSTSTTRITSPIKTTGRIFPSTKAPTRSDPTTTERWQQNCFMLYKISIPPDCKITQGTLTTRKATGNTLTTKRTTTNYMLEWMLNISNLEG